MNETLRLTANKLIALDGITRQELGERIDMPYATLAGILNGTRNGSLASWDQILGFFGFQLTVGVTPVL